MSVNHRHSNDDKTSAGAIPDLLRPEVLDAFDRETFERDGYWVWEGVVTDAGCKQWKANLKELQRLNDAILMDTDWAAIDFEGLGLAPPPPEQITPQFLESCCGGSEKMPPFLRAEARKYMHQYGLNGPGPALIAHGFDSVGVMPEYFPPGYNNFVLDVITTHPQMMELFRKVLGDRFLLDHCLLLNRAPGTKGRRWHGHPYWEGKHEEQDAMSDGSAVTPEFLQRQCVRTLCYPDGAATDDGGEFAVIPGAHLYRVPYKWNTERPDEDEDMRSGWLKGKTHPITGEPLEIVHLSLPPGSMVSFVHHMPHYVGRRKPGSEMRWGMLMAFRTFDSEAIPAKWSNGVPPHWADRLEAEGRLSVDARRVFEADNPIA